LSSVFPHHRTLVVGFLAIAITVAIGSQTALAQVRFTEIDKQKAYTALKQIAKAAENIAQANAVIKNCNSKIASGNQSLIRECISFIEEMGSNAQTFNAGIGTTLTNHTDLLPLNYTSNSTAR
jgi:vesicle coat complex subunit